MDSLKNMGWERFKKHHLNVPALGMAFDTSRMKFDDRALDHLNPKLEAAFEAMRALEKGGIANPDENRMVGHYWLRAPEIAPDPAIQSVIEDTNKRVTAFAEAVHSGAIKGSGGSFRNVILIGIGGSALGPQFVHQALGRGTSDRLQLYFFDNTDPDGMDRVLSDLKSDLGQTLAVTISKSGGTKETRNGMLEAKRAYEAAGLVFAKHAIAVTGEGSELGKFAEAEAWLDQFPMWDWVGGRTSVMSAVGLLPAALQGLDINAFLEGAHVADEVTRIADSAKNPAAQLAAMWYLAGNGTGELAMVVLPYKDRLELFSKYLQQLVMESLGKRLDLDGKEVLQGLSVYGNKGSTDQHAYVQQLRDGLNNFFVTFIEVLKDRQTEEFEVEPSVTSGDYLSGFFQGTRSALFESDRQSITITVNEVSPFTVGALIAIYERAVGFYASLINVNAYHQPGVEAGKKAAGEVIAVQKKVLETLSADVGSMFHVEQLAQKIDSDVETTFKILQHLAANNRVKASNDSDDPFAARYSAA